MLICGIDPGLATGGWALVDSDSGRLVGAGAIATSKGGDVGDTQRRLLEVAESLRGPVGSADLVVVEFGGGGFQREGADHGNHRAAMLNMAAGTVVIGLAAARRCPVLAPAPVTWRAALGHARDEQGLHARLLRAYPRTLGQFRRGALPHVLDAVGLALFGRAHSTNLFRPAKEITTP